MIDYREESVVKQALKASARLIHIAKDQTARIADNPPFSLFEILKGDVTQLKREAELAVAYCLSASIRMSSGDLVGAREDYDAARGAYKDWFFCSLYTKYDPKFIKRMSRIIDSTGQRLSELEDLARNNSHSQTEQPVSSRIIIGRRVDTYA